MYEFRGSEPLAEEAIKLICDTGGVAVLAHPWSLKNPVAIVKSLKEAGLHGIEVYRSDGKLAGMLHEMQLSVPFCIMCFARLMQKFCLYIVILEREWISMFFLRIDLHVMHLFLRI